MRTRPSANTSPFTLFAFQDIMTGVMGVLVLVTLLMAMEVAVAPTPIPEMSQDHTPAVAESGIPIGELRSQADVLRKRVAELQAEVAGLAEASAPGRTDAAYSAADKLQQINQQIERLNAQVRTRKERIASDAHRRHELALQTLDDGAAAQSLERLVEEQRRNRMLTFIVDPSEARKPLLIEVSQHAIGVGLADRSRSATWLPGTDVQVGLVGLTSILRSGSYSPRAHYAVLLLKPSSFGSQAEQIEKTVEEMGFDVGKELIQEDRTAFASAPARKDPS